MLSRIILCRQSGGDNLFTVGRSEVKIDHDAGPSVPFNPGGVSSKFVIVPIMRMQAGNVKPDDRIGI